MEGDLISRSGLTEEFEWLKANTGEYNHAEIDDYIQRIKNAPAVEAEPIIKCRDCKHWEGIDYRTYAAWCPYVGRTTHCAFYCAEGKGKE